MSGPSSNGPSGAKRRLLFVHPMDLFHPIGRAEPYYVLRRWRESLDLVRFPPTPKKLPFRILPPFLAFNLWSLFHLGNAIKEGPYDLVYAYKSALLIPGIIKARFNALWIYDLRTHPVRQQPPTSSVFHPSRWAKMGYHLAKWVVNLWAVRRCDLVVTVSPALKEELVRQFRIPEGKVYVMPLGVDLKLFKRDSPPPPCPPGPLRAVYVSSVAPYRGHATCIKAARILREKGIPCKMDFIGPGPRMALRGLKKAINAEGVHEEVTLRGALPHEQLPGELQSAHVGLSPLPDLEAYRVSSPTKIFEYMAMGLAIVASDIQAHRQFLREGETALFFPPDDPQQLAQRLIALYEDAELRKRLGNNAGEEARKYEWDRLIGSLERYLMDLLGEDRDV